MNTSLISSTEKKTSNKNKPLPWLIWALLGALLVLVLLSIIFGSSSVSLKELIEAIKGQNDTAALIVTYIRIPRVIASIAVGAALGCSGLILQSMLNNSLASPGIIGINSGAGLVVVIVSLLFPGSLIAKVIGAFIGAFFTSILIYGIAKLSGAARGTIILAGVAISGFFSAVTNTIIELYPSAILNRASFSVGSLKNITFDQLKIAVPVIIIGLIAAFLIASFLSVLSLGDDVASSLGLNVKVTRFISLLISALLASAAVAIGGLLSFLGLIAPHIVRKLIGVSNYKRLVLHTMIFGADITLLCDLLARTLFKPYELPVGIFLAVIGVPFFLFLLFSRGRRDRLDTN